MPTTRVRVAGSGFTSFNYKGQTLAWLTNVTDQGQRPGAAPQAITPIDAKYPQEIVTPRFLGMGTLTFTITEVWNQPVWQQLAGLETATAGIIDPTGANGVFERLAADPSEVWCQMIIKPPGSAVWRTKTYHNVVVYEIDDTETIEVGTMSVGRTISATYTHTTRS